MNCFNGQRYLREAIDSVYAQSYPDWEIVFFDNASTDDSAVIARSYDDRLRYFKGDRTVPLGAARNCAIEQARGEFIAFLDCDDRWSAKKLERQIPLFRDSQIGIVYSDAVVFNQDGDRSRFYDRMPSSTGECFRQLLKEYFLCMPTVMIRRTALDEVGEWFDPRFEISEEADLFIRLARRWSLAMVKEPLAEYRVHAQSSTWSRGHLVAEEAELLLSKLKSATPDFWERFGDEAEYFRMTSRLRKASYCFRTGDSRGARNCAFPYALKSRYALMLLVASFLPEAVIHPLQKWYLRKRVTAS